MRYKKNADKFYKSSAINTMPCGQLCMQWCNARIQLITCVLKGQVDKFVMQYFEIPSIVH